MWVFLSDSFLSIVAHDKRADLLMVRARFPGDIKRVFPKARVQRTRDRDYAYRAAVPRQVVQHALSAAAKAIAYPNFKNSVPADHHARHAAYLDVWVAMARAQDALLGPNIRGDSLWSPRPNQPHSYHQD